MLERNLQCRQGFTLLEVMIAMAILAISLVAVFRSQSQSVSMASEARFLTTASLLAQGKMAEMESLKPQELSDGSGGFGEDFPDYLWRVEVKDTAFQYLKKIDVIVTNSIMVTNNAYHLELYRFVRK
ncbi:MAG: type II secretion system minor pseudopilin GspI [Deltaproteobacteria bacterium]|nr:type II secretion system minor pseudopilin GspI [Deltaproteobacteria bacterium]